MSSESKVVLATGGTLLIAILMLAGLAISDLQAIRAEMRSESARLDARLLALETWMDRGFWAVEERFQAMEERFDARFARIEERMDRVLETLIPTPATPAAGEGAAAREPAPPPMSPSSVTPVPGTDLVILAGEPRPSAFWAGESGGGC